MRGPRGRALGRCRGLGADVKFKPGAFWARAPLLNVFLHGICKGFIMYKCCHKVLGIVGLEKPTWVAEPLAVL